jgi:hypothetical protein
MTSPEQPQPDHWVVVVDPLTDDGELIEEIYENQPDAYRPIKREEIRIVLETLARLDYEISYYPTTQDT